VVDGQISDFFKVYEPRAATAAQSTASSGA
jgi:hypothetical protein